MDEAPTGKQLIATIQKEWAIWQALIEKIDQDKMTQSNIVGEWSIKDVIAHITWHENEMVALITAHALVGSELWNLPTDERNASIYEKIHGQSLEQVLSESEQVHQQLLEVLPSLSDEDLITPGNFPPMPPDWQPWSIIAQNTYEHYQQHIPDVERWLEGLRSEI